MIGLIENIRFFVRVVEAGSFTAVANENGLSVTQVSRAVSALEQQLKTSLLQRTTRHLALTEAGKRFYDQAKVILGDLDNAVAEARGAIACPQGHIRVHSAPGLGQSIVVDVLLRYRAAYPEVTVELDLEQSMPNLVEEGYDLSLVSAPQLPNSAYVVRSLGTAYPVLAAAPAYLAEHGSPVSPADLDGHCLLALRSPATLAEEWRLVDGAEEAVVRLARPPFTVNSPRAMRSALIAGAGIGPLATYSVAADLVRGALQRVLPAYRLPSFTVFAIYPSRRYLDAKTRTLLDHLHATITPALAQAARDVEAPDAFNRASH